MYKILADECIHTDLVNALRNAGLDVLTVNEAGLLGVPDKVVFQAGVEKKRIILTFDRGFGDIFRFNIGNSNGVVIVLIKQMSKEEILDISTTFFVSQKDRVLAGKLIIIGKSKIRISSR